MSTEIRATFRVNAPFTRADIEGFLASVPDDRAVAFGVTTHTGGDQRDPIVTGYTFVAAWSAS